MIETAPRRATQLGSAGLDRRGRERFRLNCAVRLSRCGLGRFSEHWTEEVSCEGFSCFSDVGFTAGEILDCEINVCTGGWTDTLGDLVLRCQVEVMRSIREAGEGGFTLACRLVDYTTCDYWNLRPAFGREY